MSDSEYKSGPFKGVKKEEIRAIRNRIKTITGKTPTHKQVMDYYIDEDAFEDSFDYNKGGAVKSRTGTQDFRKGGMVISTVDNRKKK